MEEEQKRLLEGNRALQSVKLTVSLEEGGSRCSQFGRESQAGLQWPSMEVDGAFEVLKKEVDAEYSVEYRFLA